MAAIIFAGHKGDSSIEERSQRAGAFGINAAVQAFSSVQQQLIRFNEHRGWNVSVFFHTWEVEHLHLLVSLYNPVRYAVGPYIFGEPPELVAEGLVASIEIAFKLLLAAAEQHAAPYQRVVILRFDAELLRPFNLDSLTQDDAVYVASWCKATGTQADMPDGRICRQLEHNPNEVQGVPDFFFAGSPEALWPVFSNLHSDATRKVFFTGALVTYHQLFYWRFVSQNTKVRRYFQHHMDIDLVRFINSSPLGSQWTPGRRGCMLSLLAWINRPESESLTNKSQCDLGRMFCACQQSDLQTWAFVV